MEATSKRFRVPEMSASEKSSWSKNRVYICTYTRRKAGQRPGIGAPTIPTLTILLGSHSVLFGFLCFSHCLFGQRRNDLLLLHQFFGLYLFFYYVFFAFLPSFIFFPPLTIFVFNFFGAHPGIPGRRLNCER